MKLTGQWKFRIALMGGALIALSACEGPVDFDLRGLANGFNTAGAAQQATARRPAPDSRGVISYPNFQVAVARRGDTLVDVAERVGLPVGELSRYNGLAPDTVLREGEVIALPRRVDAPPAGAPGGISSGPISDTGVDITALAGNAIERAGGGQPAGAPPAGTDTVEPLRHRVERGETAFTIARLYNVSVRALAEWNGLGPDLAVREGQFLLIPVPAKPAPSAPAETAPAPRPDQTPEPRNEEPATPAPPSASAPLPEEESAAVATPPSPDLGEDRSAASDTAQLMMPTKGKIIRGYQQGKNEGINIAAPAGTPVVAAADGTVAAITRDTDQVPIIVLRHADNLLTVYAGVDNVTVNKGDKVRRGQKIAEVRAGNPSFLHFQVRRGIDSVDPMPFLQ